MYIDGKRIVMVFTAFLCASGMIIKAREWNAYFNSMNVWQSDLDVCMLGYIEKVTLEIREQFFRQRISAAGTNFIIIPLGNPVGLFSCLFINHFDWKLATIYGLDHGNRPERESVTQAVA